jgi:hypothetical protein
MKLKAVLLPALIALCSCSSQPRVATREFFDEQTASTLSVVGKPLIFERQRSDVAAHGHDFATLVAIEVNNSGQDSEYLLLYRWSTVDRRMSPPPEPDQGLLRIQADGRTIELRPLERLPVSLAQRRRLHFPEHGDVVARAYRVDLDLLRFVSTSGELVVRLPDESLDTPFMLWDDQRGSLARFAGKAP